MHQIVINIYKSTLNKFSMYDAMHQNHVIFTYIHIHEQMVYSFGQNLQ